ncbi:MAG TPA: acyl-CoA reductase, partial [Chloroflexota bacterium]|nr:acyl-CoA reductase [Chloroflexota bacterium]
RRLIAYGHKLSFGVLTRERLAETDLADLAERAAYDVARYDQQGCLSPHLFYVESGGAVGPAAFAAALGEALARWSERVPRGRVAPAERARVAEARRDAEFRAATRGGAVFGGGRDEWRVVYDPDPAFAASCLNRTIWVKPLADLADLPALLAPVRRYLQTAAVAADDARRIAAAELLAELGIDRICPLGQMGDPPITWHHDGRFNLLDFLRFCDLEPENAAGRWEFAHPDRGLLGKV